MSRRLAVLLALFGAAFGATRALPQTRPLPSPIAVENGRPGTPRWELSSPALRHEIEGYADRASAAPGETLFLCVSSVSPRFTVEVYRMGWYGGIGARRVLTLPGVPGATRRLPTPRPGDGLIECSWPVSCRIGVGRDWTTGVYLARLTATGGKQAFVPFVVRERPQGAMPDGRPGRRASSRVPPPARVHRAPLLLSLGVNTWQAYNNWGGKSLYDFNSFGGRALRVSFGRPYGAGPDGAAGVGAGELLTVSHGPIPAGWEYPFVRWLERNGYDVAYATDLDLHRDGSLLLARKGILFAGHHEYWSRPERDHVEQARDRGIHLGFFASNVSYWQVRVEPSGSGEPDRALFCAKEPERDPVYNTGGDTDLTVRFRNQRPPRPEVSLVGMMMGAENVEGDFTPLPEARGQWAYAGTGIASGRTRSIPGLLGYEVDRTFASDPVYGRFSPPGLTVLARAWVQDRSGARVPTETTVYTARSGAVVFAAGTMQWSWGLDDWGAPALRSARGHPDVARITRNVLGRFLGSGPGPGPRSPE